jgi:hypothetical protein
MRSMCGLKSVEKKKNCENKVTWSCYLITWRVVGLFVGNVVLQKINIYNNNRMKKPMKILLIVTVALSQKVFCFLL